MGLIWVRAIKDVWDVTSVSPAANNAPGTQTNGILRLGITHGNSGPNHDGTGDVFQIDESRFSDYHVEKPGKYGTVRGSMERVKSAVVDGVVKWVRDEAPKIAVPVTPAPAPVSVAASEPVRVEGEI